MTVDDITPSVGSLSHAEKIHLAQVVLQQLAHEEVESAQPVQPATEPFDPQRFHGLAHHSRQAVDQSLVSARKGWSESSMGGLA